MKLTPTKINTLRLAFHKWMPARIGKSGVLGIMSVLALIVPLGAARSATLYVAVGGAGNGSSAASPLPSVAAAYLIANQGDFIEMAAGTYNAPPQVNARAAADTWTQNVIVKPASSAIVTIDGSQWYIYGKRITLDNLNFKVRCVVRRGADYFRMQNCYSQVNTGQVSSLTLGADHAQLVNSVLDGGSGDADGLVITSGSADYWATDILVEDNIIRNYVYTAGGVHEDGIQMYDCQDVTIRRNQIINVGNSCIILSGGAANKTMNNVRVENNFLNRGASTQSSLTVDLRYTQGTNIVAINNTIIGSVGATANTGNVLRNNIISWLSSKNTGEQYNYIYQWNAGIGVVPDATSHTGPLPAFVDQTSGDLHISPANTVNLSFGSSLAAPADDVDGQSRNMPIDVGADDSTPVGAGLIAYEGFNYVATTNISGAANSTTDIGWTGTGWNSSNDVVTPGLSFSTLPYEANALQFTSNVGAQRSIDPAAMPAGYWVDGSDGVRRLGVPGTTLWISVLLRPDGADANGTLTSAMSLLGSATGGSAKVSLGDLGTDSSWGARIGAGTIATGSSTIITGTTAFLVAKLSFVSGSGNDQLTLYVNPALGGVPPTPTATAGGLDIGAFDRVEFKGARLSTGDEVRIGTTWLAVIGQ